MGRVGHFGGLSDRKNNLINQNTKTQFSVSLSVFSYIHASMPQDFLGQHGSTRHCATVISPFSLTFPRFDSHRTNPRIVNLLLALAPEQVLLEPPESESSRDKETQTSTYLIVSCHIFIPLHTQTGVKFEIDNITDLFWEQRPRLGCAGALFFKFENKYILMHVPNLQVPLGSHLTHTVDFSPH